MKARFVETKKGQGTATACRARQSLPLVVATSHARPATFQTDDKVQRSPKFRCQSLWYGVGSTPATPRYCLSALATSPSA